MMTLRVRLNVISVHGCQQRPSLDCLPNLEEKRNHVWHL